MSRFDRLAVGYDRFMHLFSLYRQDEIRDVLPSDYQDLILDVGGGTGYLLSRLSDRYRSRIVIDSSSKMLAKGRKRQNQCCQGTALQLPFRNNQFDTVLCTDALHHIKDVDQAVSEISRVLKPGGQVVVLEFHIRGPMGWTFYAFEKLLIDNSRFVTPVALRQCMAAHGIVGSTQNVSLIEFLYSGIKSEEI